MMHRCCAAATGVLLVAAYFAEASIGIQTIEASHSRWNNSQLQECPRVIPALTPSLFSNVAPVINFGLPGQIVQALPRYIAKKLQWKLKGHRWAIIIEMLERSNAFVTDSEDKMWLGCFCQLRIEFGELQPYQKHNHFPGSGKETCRKDSFWRNIKFLISKYGIEDFSFIPLTFVLPAEKKAFQRYLEENPKERQWIYKPVDGFGGKGIGVISNWDQLPNKRKKLVVQRYIENPYLIEGFKFHIRVYVCVTSIEPLRIYLHEEGMTRFASERYSVNLGEQNNTFIHITNSHVNAKNKRSKMEFRLFPLDQYAWSLRTFWQYLKRVGINTQSLWETMQDQVIKQIISFESVLYKMVNTWSSNPHAFYELYGADFMMDDKLNLWLLEFNHYPGLSATTALSKSVAEPIAQDVFNIAGHRLPKQSSSGISPFSLATLRNSSVLSNGFVGPVFQPPSLLDSTLTAREKRKRLFFTTKVMSENVSSTILDDLTPADVRELVEAEDEYQRRGGFQRIFPSLTSHKYFKYFERTRYSNLLLDAWTKKYHHQLQKGWQLLEEFCRQGIHLLDENFHFKTSLLTS